MDGLDPVRFGTGDLDDPWRKPTLLGDRQREREDKTRLMGDIAARLLWDGGVGESPPRPSPFGANSVFCAFCCCDGLGSVEGKWLDKSSKPTGKSFGGMIRRSSTEPCDFTTRRVGLLHDSCLVGLKAPFSPIRRLWPRTGEIPFRRTGDIKEDFNGP